MSDQEMMRERERSIVLPEFKIGVLIVDPHSVIARIEPTRGVLVKEEGMLMLSDVVKKEAVKGDVTSTKYPAICEST